MRAERVSTLVDLVAVGTNKPGVGDNVLGLHVVLDVVLAVLQKATDSAGPARGLLHHHGHNRRFQFLQRF